MNRIQTTWQLAKASWEVLKADKELMLLPVMSAIATILVAVSYFLPVFGLLGLVGGEGAVGPIAFVFLFVGYLLLAYVTIFFNAALVSAAIERLEGGDPTLGSALRGAASRAGKIAPWAIVSATVSAILRSLEERGGALGRIGASIAGVAWSLVTYLVLPVIVVEGLGVMDAIRRSGELFRQTWGENVAGHIGFGLLGFLALFPAGLIAGLAASAGGVVAAAGFVLAVAWAIVAIVVIAALSGIFQAALYRYAATGEVGAAFDATALRQAFRPT